MAFIISRRWPALTIANDRMNRTDARKLERVMIPERTDNQIPCAEQQQNLP